MKSSPSTAIDINEPFFKKVVFCFFLSFSSDVIDDGSLIHIYPVSLILKPIKLFIVKEPDPTKTGFCLSLVSMLSTFHTRSFLLNFKEASKPIVPHELFSSIIRNMVIIFSYRFGALQWKKMKFEVNFCLSLVSMLSAISWYKAPFISLAVPQFGTT